MLTYRQIRELAEELGFPVVDQEGLSCCRIHQVVDVSKLSPEGCGGHRVGTHRSIAALYAKPPTRFCHAQEGQLVLDKRLWEKALAQRYNPKQYMHEDALVWMAKYFRGAILATTDLGAGYCYVIVFREGFGMRAARTLGPLAYLVGVYVLFCMAGASVGPRCELKRVGAKEWHVEVLGGVDLHFGKNMNKALLDAIAETPDGRIGVSEAELANAMALLQRAGFGVVEPATERVPKEVLLEKKLGGLLDKHGYPVFRSLRLSTEAEVTGSRVARLQAMLVSVGVVFPREAVVELGLATSVRAVLVGPLACFLAKHKVLGVLGDVTLKMHAALRVLASRGTGAAYASLQEEAKNRVMGQSFARGKFAALVNWGAVDPSGGSKAVADVVEAFIGVVALYCGMESAFAVAVACDVCPSVADSVSSLRVEQEDVQPVVASGSGTSPTADSLAVMTNFLDFLKNGRSA